MCLWIFMRQEIERGRYICKHLLVLIHNLCRTATTASISPIINRPHHWQAPSLPGPIIDRPHHWQAPSLSGPIFDRPHHWQAPPLTNCIIGRPHQRMAISHTGNIVDKLHASLAGNIIYIMLQWQATSWETVILAGNIMRDCNIGRQHHERL